MNFSLDFMWVPPWRFQNFAAPRPWGAGVRWLVLSREDDLHAPVARAAAGRRVGAERVHRAVSGRPEAAGRDVIADQESDDGGRAGGRQLPVRRELAVRDRLVVGVALDHDGVVELRAQERRDAVEQGGRRRVERRAAAVVQHLVGEQPDDEAAARDGRLELVREAVLLRVAVDLNLELLEVLVLLRGGLRGLLRGVELLRDRLDRRDRRRRGRAAG